MYSLARLVIVRHGETVGESSIRYHGINDVELSDLGRVQAEEARLSLLDDSFDELVASPLVRASETAALIAPGKSVHIETDFREVNFGRWEGLTREEIAVLDPELHDEWQRNPQVFGYPGGESRHEFRARVERGLGRLLAGDARSVLLVAHKGVIRILVGALLGAELEPGEPQLGAVLRLAARAGGGWRLVAG